jgi:tol-pal system protein YbgF
MVKTTAFALLLAGLSTSMATAAPGDYDPAYDQGGGYGAVTLDERVAKLEKKLSGDSQIELLNRVEQLQSDVLRLRGEVEELTHQLESAKRLQKQHYLDLDRRVQAVTPPPPASEQPPAPEEAPASDQAPSEQPPTNPAPAQQNPVVVPTPAPAAAPPVTPTPAPSLVPATPAATMPAAPLARPFDASKQPSPAYAASTRTPAPAAPPAGSEARQAAYQKGFNLMTEGKYPEAIKELKGFLAVYPKGEYSDNAAYWLAEAHYVNRDLAAARDSFRKVVKEYPQAAKVSDAQLKLGYIDYDTGQWASARETLGEVIKRFPDTSAAKLAQRRLDRMKQEGH